MSDTAQATAAPLSDTPAWSPARRATIRSSLWTGIGLTTLGAFGTTWGMSDAIATLVINAGTTIIMSSASLHIGGATMERVGAWWVNRTVQPPAAQGGHP